MIMGQLAAKKGDLITATDTHITLVSSPAGPVPTPGPYEFNGIIDDNLSPDVNINGLPAATMGSTASNTPPHIPIGGPFQMPPTNKGIIITGSSTVSINGKPAARMGDTANTCNDPMGMAPVGQVTVNSGDVLIG
jgi:uncharacterized Zn-binding protein involved in type VI secretion